MPAKVTWSTYYCQTCQAYHEMRGTKAQLQRQGATRCPSCAREMQYVTPQQEAR